MAERSAGRSVGLNELVPEGAIEINPEDAADLHILNGDEIRLTSRRGEVTGRARLTRKCRGA